MLSLDTLISNDEDAKRIAMKLGPFFQSRMMDNLGNPAITIAVNDVKYTSKEEKEYKQFELQIHYVSDQGQLHQGVTVRQYHKSEDFNLEMDRYGEIVERSLLFQDLAMSPLVNVDAENNAIIHEKVGGSTIGDLGFSQNLKDYLLGRVYGILHGSETDRVSETTAREFFVFLLKYLPFTSVEKEKLIALLEKHFGYFSQCYGGFKPQIQVLSDNIVFQMSDGISHMDKSMIDSGGIIQVSVNYQRPDELTDDRMRDIAYHFSDRVYNEFTNSGTVSSAAENIREFFEGYKSVASILNLPPFSEMYPSGNTLNIQLVFTIWLKEIEKIQQGVEMSMDNKDLLRYSYFLLTQNLFDDLF
ncbi:MAG: hypothetical protein GPJ54_04690 [Candidatus Heimdallarchaeota archaeon]|nr:hypothetical protein [Candidatus Heimdallarchaeota archaeon]